MFSKFLNLKQEKQDRIMNAALKEFAQKGYANASTNEIVKNAEISKGLLFHYFKNKKQLFLFLLDHSIELIGDELLKKIDLSETDFFVRILQTSKVKMELLNQYPEMFKFVETVYLEDDKEVKAELEKKLKPIKEMNLNKMYQGLDFSKFKDGIDVEKAIKTVTWTIEGIGNEAMQKAKQSQNKQINYEQVFAEAQEYMDLLKMSFYR